jgi:hypothetical protein
MLYHLLPATSGAPSKQVRSFSSASPRIRAHIAPEDYPSNSSFSLVVILFSPGNTIQLSLAVARLFSGPNQHSGFLIPDRQALVSLISFLGGSFLGRLGDRPILGGKGKSRGWLSLATLIQAGLTLASALCALTAHESGLAGLTRAELSWTDTRGFLALAFSSASMGLQALIGTKLGSHFAT